MIRKLLAMTLLMSVGVALQACGIKPSPQESCNFLQNSSLQRVSWGGRAPVVLYIHSSVPSAYFDSIREAAVVWNRAIGREVIRIGGWTDTNDAPKQDGVNVIYYLRSWENERAIEQARTTVYWAGDRIYEADVRINGRDFNFFAGTDPVYSQVDLLSLMVHEFGHVLGLAHSHTPQSVMATSLPSATLRRDLSADDLNSIRCEY
jgi:hypothetical protein